MKQVIIIGFLILSGSIMITGGMLAIELSSGASDGIYLLVMAGIVIFISSIIGLAYVKETK